MRNITIKKGIDLRLAGGLQPGSPTENKRPETVAIFPSDFPGFTPKAVVKEGENVALGAPLMVDKTNPNISLVSPVSGTVKAVNRGERRKLISVVVEPSNTDNVQPSRFDIADIAPEELRQQLQKSGWWALMRQRPFDIVPDPNIEPRDIFITAFDSAPLAPSLTDFIDGSSAKLQKAVDILKKLTKGKIFLAVRPDMDFSFLKGVETVTFKGPHPSGNVGVQIANIAPINKGETVWTLDIVTLWRLGCLCETGCMDFATKVAVTGPEIDTPRIIDTLIGADIKSLLGSCTNDASHNLRIISGNVLSGVKVALNDGYLHYPYRQITVIREGDDIDEFMGWASNSTNKMSQSRSFLSHFFKHKQFSPDARLNGGRRAMIMSGLYDDVFPMDILPEYLIKAILSRDIDRMEALGIYEVAPEDFALAEYVDPSKLELQKIVREGLDYIRKELS